MSIRNDLLEEILAATEAGATDPTITTLTEGQVPKADATQKLVYGDATVDPATLEWAFDQTINLPPASINLGPALTMSERGGYLQVEAQVTDKQYLAAMYQIESTGTGRPFVGVRGPQLIREVVQPVDTTSMIGVTVINLPVPRDEDVSSLYFKFINPVTNFRAITTSDTTGNIIDYYPSGKDIRDGTGQDFAAGEQIVQFLTPLSLVDGFAVTITMEADQSIDLLGDGVTPWIADDYQEITIEDIVTDANLLYKILTNDYLLPGDEFSAYLDASLNPITITLATNPEVGLKKEFFIEDNTNPITIKSESPSFPIAPPIPIAEANVEGQWALSGDFLDNFSDKDLTTQGAGGSFVPVLVNGNNVTGFDFEGTAYLEATVTSYKGVTGNTPRSLTCWYQANAGTPTGLETIAMWGDESAQGRAWQVAFRSDLGASGTLAISNFGASRQFPYASLTNLFDGNAHHIAVTQQGASTANIALYIDGVRITPSTTDSNPACNTTATNDLRFGNSINGSRPLNATLYDCRLWDIGLSEAQVLDVMGQNLDGSRVISNAPPHTIFEMMFNGTEWHFGDGITNFILNNEARISAIEATYVTTNNHEREYFVSVSAGDDANTGLNALDQMATLNAALTAAGLLVPAPSSIDRASITDLSTSEYVLTSDIILPTGLIMSLPHSGIKGDAGVAVEVNTDSNLIIGRLIPGDTDGSTGARLAGTNASLTATNIIIGDVGLNQIGIRMLGQGVNVNVNSIESRSTGCTLLLMDGSSNNSQPIYFDRMVLGANDSSALAVNTADPVSISVGSITDGGNTGCNGLFVASNGNVSLDAISMDADILLSGGTSCEINLGSMSDSSTLTVESTATLNIWCTRGNPTVVNNGTINGYIGGTYYGNAIPVAEELSTVETDPNLKLVPDTSGGVEWVVDPLGVTFDADLVLTGSEVANRFVYDGLGVVNVTLPPSLNVTTDYTIFLENKGSANPVITILLDGADTITGGITLDAGDGSTITKTTAINYNSALITPATVQEAPTGQLSIRDGSTGEWKDSTVIAGSPVYNFSVSIAATDPGNGGVKFNNSDPSLVTEVYVSALDKDGTDLNELFSRLTSGDNIGISEHDKNTNFSNVILNAAAVDNTGWFTLPVTVTGSGTILGDTEATSLNIIATGGRAVPRLTTVMSATLVLDGTEQIIEFDPAQTLRTEGFTVNAGGSFTVDNDGYYQGTLALFVDKSGGAGVNLSIWVEIKPIATGVWQHTSTSMSNPIVYDDGGQPVALTGTVDALAGDEVRVMIKENSGTGSLITISNVLTLGTLFDYAAALSVSRIGPVTP